MYVTRSRSCLIALTFKVMLTPESTLIGRPSRHSVEERSDIVLYCMQDASHIQYNLFVRFPLVSYVSAEVDVRLHGSVDTSVEAKTLAAGPT